MSRPKQLTYRIIFGLITVLALMAVPIVGGQKVSAHHATECSDVFTPLSDFVVSGVNANKEFYVDAMNETGVPWELLAAIHYRETNFSHTNPGNGQGIFQFVGGEGGPYPAGPVSDAEFYRQLKFMANELQDDYVWRGSVPRERRELKPNETNMALVKDTLFSYNGRATAYANQAEHFGYDKTKQPYEGSPYVMNRYDCPRARMGIITQDFGPIDGQDTRYGAFTIFARLSFRVIPALYDTTTDKTGEQAKIGYRLSRKPTAPVTIHFHVNSPGSAEIAGSPYLTITAASWNDPSKNTMVIKGKNNTGQTGTLQYWLIPSRPDSGDGNYRNLSNAQVGSVPLVNLEGSGALNVYRLYSSAIGKHFFTGSAQERDEKVGQGWTSEGTAFTYCAAGEQTVYRVKEGEVRRLVTEGSGQHSQALIDGFVLERVDFAASGQGTIPVYERYDSARNRYLYTTSPSEGLSSGFTDMGIAFYACQSDQMPVYRLYRPLSGYFLTASPGERDKALYTRGYKYEKLGFYVCDPGDVNVYRLYRASTGHFYTTSVAERDKAKNNLGYQYDGVVFKVCSGATRDVHRLFRQSTGHLYTTSVAEKNKIIDNEALGYQYDGVVFKAE